jgi:ComF family protein
MARAAAVYNHLTMALLHGFKYSGKIQLAGPLGALLAASWLKSWAVGEFDVVLPVPLHRRRIRRRGFNQAYLLVESLMKKIIEMTGRDSAVARVERAALRRVRATASQTGLRRKGRLENIRNAFEVVEPAVVTDKRVLLVDDIYTTGATVNECARVLIQSGAVRVDVLTVARAV